MPYFYATAEQNIGLRAMHIRACKFKPPLSEICFLQRMENAEMLQSSLIRLQGASLSQSQPSGALSLNPLGAQPLAFILDPQLFKPSAVLAWLRFLRLEPWLMEKDITGSRSSHIPNTFARFEES